MKRFGCCSTCLAEVTLGGRLDTVGGPRVGMGGEGGGGTVEATVGQASTVWWVVLALSMSMMLRVVDRSFLVGEGASCVASVWRGRGRRIVRPGGHKHECSNSGPRRAPLVIEQQMGLILKYAWQALWVVGGAEARSRQGKQHVLTGEAGGRGRSR